MNVVQSIVHVLISCCCDIILVLDTYDFTVDEQYERCTVHCTCPHIMLLRHNLGTGYIRFHSSGTI